jgi:transitional endoplasmic reticulum ATPase
MIRSAFAVHDDMPASPKSEQASRDAQINTAVLEALQKLGGGRVQEDALLFEGEKFILPGQYNGKTEEAIKFLQQHIEQEKKVHSITRTFKYRPNDVSYAVKTVMKKLFGTTGLGKDFVTMFGSTPPEFKTIDIGLGQTDQVPAGLVELPAIQGVIAVGAVRDRELGLIGHLSVDCPRKYRSQVEGFFRAIEEELKTGSIYRGKAFYGSEDITFLDTSQVDPAKVVYSDRILEELAVHLWSPIQHTALLRSLGQSVKRAVLLHGPYGTGKSLAGYLTAQKAQANGWTFIFVRPTDNLEDAMKTAQLYAPAVVFFEDIDVVADSASPERTSKLLDAADGITGKGKEVIVVMTTNHVLKIHKGMLRPGRMDAVIEIGELDASGVKRLIQNTIPAKILSDDVDYDMVAKSVAGYMPAFVNEAVGRAFKYALVRNNGSGEAVLTTHDFVSSAEGLRSHFELMTGAHEGKAKPSLDLALREVVKDTLESARGFNYDDDELSSSHGAHHVVVGDEQVHPKA